LREGDSIIIADNGTIAFSRVASVTSSTNREPVYNLVTEGEHNFIVGGVVAHNFTVLRRTRVLAHRALDRLATLGGLPMPELLPSPS
jgi:hypothetical protein